MSNDLLNEMINGLELKSMSKDDLHILGDILQETVCNNSSVFSMLLNSNTAVSVSDIKEAASIEDLIELLGSGISAEINFEAGIKGTQILFFKNKEAAIFANTVMGAELKDVENEPQIGELQLSAFAEIVTQFSSKITTSLTSCLETKIGALSPSVKKQDGKKLDVTSAIAGSPVLMVVYDLDLGLEQTRELYQIISLDLAFDIVEQYKEAKIPNYNMLKGYSENSSQKVSPESLMKEVYASRPVTVQPVKFSSFDNSPSVVGEGKNLDLLMDIKLKLTVELGRTEMPIKKVLELARGSVIELDKIAGEPVELYANGKLIANGEVVVIEDNFGLRITSILSPDHRLKNL